MSIASAVLQHHNTNEIVCTFNTSLRKLLDKHVPLRKIRIRTKPHPWYDQEVESIGASVKICGDSQVSILREHCTQRLVIMSISMLTGKILFSI